VETRTINGEQATDRAGAAEFLGMPRNTVNMYSSPSRRPRTGFPDPLPDQQDGRDWFPLAALAAYKARLEQATPAPTAMGDPEQLIDTAEFAALRGIKRQTIWDYVKLSVDAWDRGEDGYLPQPDESSPARHGTAYRWRRGRAVAWMFPAQRRTGGRRPAPHPTVEDLDAVLAAGQLSNREIAAALGERLGSTVSLQTVLRLKRRRRERDADTTGG
jgi:hypothetical protein